MIGTTRSLAERDCQSCKGIPPMARSAAEHYLRSLPGWILRETSIEKEFSFPTYVEGLDFAYSVGHFGEQQNHHPDILVGWRRVKLTLTTYSIKGLSENDFIMAAKAEIEYARAGA